MRTMILAMILGLALCATPALAVDDFYGGHDAAAGASSRPHGTDGYASRHGDSFWEESYSQTIDMRGFLARLYEVLTREDWLGQVPQVKQTADYLKAAGLFSVGIDHTEYEISGDSITFSTYTTFNDLDPMSYYGQIVSLPDAKLVSAKYVPADEALLYIAANNVPQMLMIQAQQIMAASGQAEKLGGDSPLSQLSKEFGLGDAEQIWSLVQALKLDQVLGSMLTGEVALAVYKVPAAEKMLSGDIQPTDFDAVLIVGIKDTKYITEMIERYGGEVGLQGLKSEDSKWQRYTMPGMEGFGAAYNDEVLIVSTNLDSALAHAKTAARSGIKAPACQLYCDLNMQRLHDEILSPLAKYAASELPEGTKLPTDAMAYLVNLPETSALGHIVVTSDHQDGCSASLSLNKAVVQYAVYYAGVVGCGVAQVEMKKHAEDAGEAQTAPLPEALPEAAPEAAPKTDAE